MIERERARVTSQAIGNALLVAAAIVFVVGAICIGVILEDVDRRFGIGSDQGPGLVDYLWAGLSYSLMLSIVTALLGSTGFYFRWLALEQDARMAEFDLLLDVIEGVEPEDIEPDNDSDAEPETA